MFSRLVNWNDGADLEIKVQLLDEDRWVKAILREPPLDADTSQLYNYKLVSGKRILITATMKIDK